MDPTIVSKDSIFVVGYELRTDSERAGEEVPRFWGKVDLERLDSLSNRTQSTVGLMLQHR